MLTYEISKEEATATSSRRWEVLFLGCLAPLKTKHHLRSVNTVICFELLTAAVARKIDHDADGKLFLLAAACGLPSLCRATTAGRFRILLLCLVPSWGLDRRTNAGFADSNRSSPVLSVRRQHGATYQHHRPTADLRFGRS